MPAKKTPDKYSAVWVSHSSMGDFLKCPRCYYLHNVYKDPKTRRKINIVSPALSLGSAVHETVESLAKIPAEKRRDYFKKSDTFFPDASDHTVLLEIFEKAWQKVSGKKGGFKTTEEESAAKARGVAMIRRVATHPEPLLEKTIRFGAAKMADGGMLPNFFLSEKDNIILCGKVDWLIHKPADDSVHILDFKTGKNEEKDDSLQLPIYLLLLDHLQKRKVSGASYWYLDRDDMPFAVELPMVDIAFDRVMKVAREVKKARDEWAAQAARTVKQTVEKSAQNSSIFQCPNGQAGCFACKPFEAILRGEADYVGVGEYNQDLYMIP